MDVLAPLVADREAPELAEPGQGALHHPAMAAQSSAGLDTPAGDPCPDPPAAQGLAAARLVVGLIGMQLGGSPSPLAGWAPDRRDGVEHLLERDAVVPIGAGQACRERGAPAVDHHVALGARLGPVRRVRAGRAAPFLAATLALSRQARDQSICSAWPSRSSSAR